MITGREHECIQNWCQQDFTTAHWDLRRMLSIKYASNSEQIGIAHLCRRAFYSSHVCTETKFPQLKWCMRRGGWLRAPWWIMQKCSWVFKQLALDLIQGMITIFQWSYMDVKVGLWRKLRPEELMLLNCGVGEDSWESLGLQGDPTSPFWRRLALRFLWKKWC